MRRPIITQAWLAEFYAEGVKSKYKGSLKPQAASNKQQATSNKQQAAEGCKPELSGSPSIKHQANLDTSCKLQATSNKRLET